jgi:hypothetical protein
MLLGDTVIDHKGLSSMSIDDRVPDLPQLPPMQFKNQDFSMKNNPESGNSQPHSSGAYFWADELSTNEELLTHTYSRCLFQITKARYQNRQSWTAFEKRFCTFYPSQIVSKFAIL